MLLQPNPPYWPSPRSGTVDINTTDWRVIGINKDTLVVTPYATMALLLAAGDRPFPGLDPGGRIGQCFIQALTSSGAVGSGVLYKCDPVGGVAPTVAADADNEVDGGGQQVSLPCPFTVIWLKALDATDLVKLSGRY